MTNTLKIATRKSALAMWQAEYVKSRLLEFHPGLDIELVPMSTQGDKILDTPLAKIGGKGLFLKELEQAILDGRADIAVHSMKDVPVEFPAGLALTHICPREDPRDAFVSNKYNKLEELPAGSVIGTSSLRREAQLKHFRDDLVIKSLRGNVNTRLKKLDDGEYDAIILASAGLLRLEFHERIKEHLSIQTSLPAVGQGAVGIECRSEDEATHRLLDCLHHEETATRLAAERAMNRELQGGCQVPIAGHALIEGSELTLEGRVASVDGKQLLVATHTGTVSEAESIGIRVAKELLSQGADKILEEVYGNGN